MIWIEYLTFFDIRDPVLTPNIKFDVKNEFHPKNLTSSYITFQDILHDHICDITLYENIIQRFFLTNFQNSRSRSFRGGLNNKVKGWC